MVSETNMGFGFQNVLILALLSVTGIFGQFLILVPFPFLKDDRRLEEIQKLYLLQVYKTK